MSTRAKNTRGKPKIPAQATAKTAVTTRKSPRKVQRGAKDSSPHSEETEENVTSSYFKEDEDSDVLDEDSDVGKKRRKSSAANGRKTSSPRKKRKLDEDEEEYDESDEQVRSAKKVYDSDDLDEDSDEDTSKRRKKSRASDISSPKKPKQTRKKKNHEVDSEAEFDVDIQDGQEIVGVVVQAPKTGLVPPGQISQNTLDFLTKLKDPACNDRQWFKLHEPVYRQAEKEWKDFVEAFTDVLVEVDTQIPPLPPKDVIHRIYRDIRFSNDKTPYKPAFSASFSRSGRKGIFAHYHLAVKPGNESIIAAGSWCPGKNELATIRANIQRNPRRLRNIISAPEFVRLFGEPRPHPKGKQQNIFGQEGELKTAPKGVGKDHKDIDLLKCRTFVVVHRFTKSEVLDPGFKENIAKVLRVMQPFVHCLNDMLTVMADDDDDDEDGDGEDGDENGQPED